MRSLGTRRRRVIPPRLPFPVFYECFLIYAAGTFGRETVSISGIVRFAGPEDIDCQKDYDRRMRNAYAMNNYAEAEEALQKIFRQLERINPSAARSLEEGLEETLTVHRLGVGAVLRRKLATTNPIESCLSTVQRVARNVKRWREGDQPLRWTATGLLEAEKKFRRIKGYQEILLLKERLNPSHIQQKEVRTVEVA
jgi:hypothetical protein